MAKRQIQVSLEQETIADLDREAASTSRSRSYVAAQRIECGLATEPADTDARAQADLVAAAGDAREWLGDAPTGNSPHCTAKRNLCLQLDDALAPFAEVDNG